MQKSQIEQSNLVTNSEVKITGRSMSCRTLLYNMNLSGTPLRHNFANYHVVTLNPMYYYIVTYMSHKKLSKRWAPISAGPLAFATSATLLIRLCTYYIPTLQTNIIGHTYKYKRFAKCCNRCNNKLPEAIFL